MIVSELSIKCEAGDEKRISGYNQELPQEYGSVNMVQWQSHYLASRKPRVLPLALSINKQKYAGSVTMKGHGHHGAVLIYVYVHCCQY